MSLLKTIKSWFDKSPTSQQPTFPFPENRLPDEDETLAQQPVSETPHEPALPETISEAPESETSSSHEPSENDDETHEIDSLTLRQDVEFNQAMLEQAIIAHKTWFGNLEAALRGKNPSIYKTKLASDDRLSELGKWLYKNDKIFNSYSEYHILIELHKRFHECAGEVVEHHRYGRFADAILLLRRDLSLLSDEVQKSLTALHERVQEKNKKAGG